MSVPVSSSAFNENTQRLDVLIREYATVNDEIKELTEVLKLARARKKELDAEITRTLYADRRKQYQASDMIGSVELRPFKKQTRITNDMAMEAFILTIGGENQALKDSFIQNLEELKEDRKEMTERLKFTKS